MFKKILDTLLFIDGSEKNVYIRTIEHGLKFPNGFSYGEIIHSPELKLKEWEKAIVIEYLKNAYENFTFGNVPEGNADRETLFLLIKQGQNDFAHTSNRYAINLDSYFKFIDYEEIRLARKAAWDAKALSWLAIIIAILVPFLAAKLMSQSVSLEHNQFEQLKALFDKNSR